MRRKWKYKIALLMNEHNEKGYYYHKKRKKHSDIESIADNERYQSKKVKHCYTFGKSACPAMICLSK